MRKRNFAFALMLHSVLGSPLLHADDDDSRRIRERRDYKSRADRDTEKDHDQHESYFRHVATFDVMAGNGSGVAEIIDADSSGRQVVYTDAATNSIGLINTESPFNPLGLGTIAVGGEPTSLVMMGKWILIAVNTSESYTSPSGNLIVIHRLSRSVIATHALNGQPDSISISPDKQFAAIVIENERDEDLNGGFIPQNESGRLVIVDLAEDDPSDWSLRDANLTAVENAAFAGIDLEPEYVDINRKNEAVVTFQENNHLAVIDLASGETISQFSAGQVTLDSVDTLENDLIQLDSSITKRREPDAVAWIDNDHFATANEGDYEDTEGEEGGSRGFTIFEKSGIVVFESGESFEHWIVSAGHYNEGRSENKGCEPEAVEFAKIDGVPTLFVGSERCNVVGVYDVSDPWCPIPIQLLPTGIGPEGLKAIPKKQMLLVSTEKDVAEDGIPTMVNIFLADSEESKYPMIASSADEEGNPIPWVALSGLTGDPIRKDTLYAVSDSFLAEGFVYRIDSSQTPAVIDARIQVIGASAGLDLEGIAVDEDGYFWLGSEGNDGSRPNLVLKVDPSTGLVIEEIELPNGLVDQRRSNGIEGIAVRREELEVGGEEFDVDVVYVAIQRAWPNEGDIDGVNTKIGRYDIVRGWSFVHYPLQPVGNGGWIGLSELTLLPNGKFAVIERDKGWGFSTPPNAELKAVFTVDLSKAEFRPYDDSAGLVTIEKKPLADLLPTLEATSIWTAEKVEGLGVTRDGSIYAITDNDGVDDAPGETIFFKVGRFADRDQRDDDDDDRKRRKRHRD